jgi:hypothetical protein
LPAPLNIALDLLMTLEEFLVVCGERAPTIAEIEAYSKTPELTWEAALNSLAVGIARRYDSGAMAFSECDAVMNELYTFSLFHRDRVLPDPAHQVFVAFDEGEYHHPGDSDDVDPEEKYTRPMIREVLRGLGPV